MAQRVLQYRFNDISFEEGFGGHRRSVPFEFVPTTSERAGAPPLIIVVAFLLLGAFWGCWAMALPDIQRTFHLNDGSLGLVLAISVGVAGFAGAVVGRLARRFPALHLLSALMVIWALSAVPVSLTHSVVLFAVAFGLAQIAAGCVDAAMNAPVTVHFIGYSGALVRFHSIFNIGALLGAALGSAALAAGASWRWLWPGVALLGVLAGALGLAGRPGVMLDVAHRPHSPTLTPVGESAPEPLKLRRSLREDGLLAFLVIFALAEVTEGGAFTWGVLYLRHYLHAGILVGAGAYIVGHGVAALSRLFGGTALRNTPVARAFVVGSGVCAAGLVLEVATHTALFAALGLTLATAGTSFFWPLVMSTIAARSSSPGQAVGSFTAAGYVGWVAGAPIIGYISQQFGARAGLLAMAGICVLVIGAVTSRIVPQINGTFEPTGRVTT